MAARQAPRALDPDDPFAPYPPKITLGTTMYSKADATSAPGRASNVKSVLAADLVITGEITSSGHVEILGQVDGNITAQGVIIGAEGRLNGQISAQAVEIKGKLDGRVTAGDFALRSTSDVQAEVTYRSLTIDSGARIEGRFALTRD